MDIIIKGLSFIRVGQAIQRTFSVVLGTFYTGSQLQWEPFFVGQNFTSSRWQHDSNLYGDRLFLRVQNASLQTVWAGLDLPNPTKTVVFQEVSDGFIFDFNIDFQPQATIPFVYQDSNYPYRVPPVYDVTTDIQIGDVYTYGDYMTLGKNVEVTGVSTFTPYGVAVDADDSDTAYVVPFFPGFEIESETESAITFNFRPYGYRQWYKEIWTHNPIYSIDYVSDVTWTTINNIYPASDRYAYSMEITDIVYNTTDVSTNNLWHSFYFG